MVNKSIITCRTCNKEFEVFKCRVGHRFCCSKECQIKWRHDHARGYLYSKCVECGKTTWNGNKLCGSCCKKGSRSYRWRGGITSLQTKIRLSEEYLKFRLSVIIRDKHICQKCGMKDRKPQVHHIKHFSEFPELRMNKNNVVTLCKICHKSIHRAERLPNIHKEWVHEINI